VRVKDSSGVVIIGAGGFSRELMQYVLDEGRLTVRGFLDDRDPMELKLPAGTAHLGAITSYQPTPGEAFVLAVGEPNARARIAERFLKAGARFETVVHPRAYVASSATVGAGSVIAPFASVGASAVVGELVQVHFYASVAHDALVGRCAALSPYSVVNGGGRLGERVFLGTRATVNPTKSVGDGSKVTAGSVVYQDVPSDAIAMGNPAKSRRLMRAPDAEQNAG
jgi:sugar O-acyltransferase (sialic acid O-acetyltransferase NeuD family)